MTTPESRFGPIGPGQPPLSEEQVRKMLLSGARALRQSLLTQEGETNQGVGPVGTNGRVAVVAHLTDGSTFTAGPEYGPPSPA